MTAAYVGVYFLARRPISGLNDVTGTIRCDVQHFMGFIVEAVVTLHRGWRNRLSSDLALIIEAREKYARGEIDKTEFERRVAFHVDDRNAQIRADVESVPGIGSERSPMSTSCWTSCGTAIERAWSRYRAWVKSGRRPYSSGLESR
ncbi:hypothetical protein [Halosolutus amylolyticus]|uniref:hypothetical protein n=1 Tax=Halosolutus amylolyticus TaxID=2932267 RepID=UPI002022B313|nr:hypothetical protein [Halosolutus amylolyticus]